MDFSKEVFEESKKIAVPEDCDIVFVADLFAEDYAGGAELTTEALIEGCPFKVFKIRSSEVKMEHLEQGFQKYWIFGNFANLPQTLIPTIAANLKYSILEYDFKYCRYRSPQKHELAEGKECDCHQELHGKMVSAFMHGAQSLWWMSERQQEHYNKLFPFLQKNDQVVLSSVFDQAFWISLKELRAKYADAERTKWIVLGSPSWVKGADQSEAVAKQKGYDYEVVWGLAYAELLEKLASAKGFCYHPAGWDTCPRMVIEAQLLGCELDINENVLHKDEIWFSTQDRFDTEAYLFGAVERFWRGIKASWQWRPSISGYTTTLNCNRNEYPWRDCVQSLLGFCDEVVVVDGGSDDGTWEELEEWAQKEERLKIHKEERDWDHPRHAVFDGAQKALARSLCTGDMCWQQDADEVLPESDYEKVINLARNFPPQAELLSLPVVEFWGNKGKVRMDVNPWKWRLSRNKDYITHGIPAQFRRKDEDGNLYAGVGTDGCDYIHKETGEIIPHASFYNSEAHNLRVHALQGNEKALELYTDWFKRNVEAFPSVRHYSWFDLPRKIRTYKTFWSSFWRSLYNIEQEDTAENNMFFDKPWSEVSEEDIEQLAERLQNEFGGHVFHSKIDWSKPTPWIEM